MTGILLQFSCVTAALASEASHTAVSQEDASKWLRWLIPLPKEVAILQKVRLSTDEVKVSLRPGASEVEQNAAARLAKVLGQEVGGSQGTFEILIGICDASGKLGDVPVPGAARLKDLPNSEQAYYIGPVGDNQLVVTALNEKGIVYGVLTLRTLIEPTLSGRQVELPLMTVTDWPDIPERGRALGAHDVSWLASVKMNLIEVGSKTPLKYRKPDDGGSTGGEVDAKTLKFCRLRAIRVMPKLVAHLDNFGRTGVYAAYPDLLGKSSGGAPCISNPKLVPVLAELMMQMAKQPGVTDISCWLTEHHVGCNCEQCRITGQFVGEAQAFVDAWKIARQKYPRLQVYLLLTQGSYQTNDKILALLPKEVGVTYYDGGRTYGYGITSREPMVYPLMAKYAGGGGRLGVDLVIQTAYCNVCPWSSPQFAKYRMNGFVDRKVSRVKSYSRQDRHWHEFSYAAAAEWQWNAKGRSERELALAWATRKRFDNPEAIADWLVMMGPVSWHVYGSGTPFLWMWGKVEGTLQNQPAPQLGGYLFRYYPTLDQFDRDLAVTEKALRLVRQQDQESLDVQLLLDETLIVQGYVQMTKQFYPLAKRLSRKEPLTDNEKVEMSRHMGRLLDACKQTTSTLKSWAKKLGSESRAGETVMFTEKMVHTLAGALTAHGLKTEVKDYLSGKSKTWTGNLDPSQAPPSGNER